MVYDKKGRRSVITQFAEQLGIAAHQLFWQGGQLFQRVGQGSQKLIDGAPNMPKYSNIKFLGGRRIKLGK